MKKVGIILLFCIYAVTVIAFGVYQYQKYQKSFDRIVPYSHTLEISPTETLPEISPSAEIPSETVVTKSPKLPTETMFPDSRPPRTTPPPQTPLNIPPATTKTTTATIQENSPEIPQETKLLVNYPLNLNTATFEELCTLPEIGEVLAQAILDYRDRIGGFINREQLLEISGIGQSRYSAIAPLLMIENEQPLPTEPPQTPSNIPPATIQEISPEIPQETKLLVNYPLNLNTATFEELCTLPEIGKVLAQAILDYRDRIGGFINREQLLEISGIGQSRYSAIAPLLMIENEQPLPTEPPPPDPEPPEIPYINLNTTTKEQLMLLPDCTERIAETIIELREDHIHTFSNPLEILYVSAIAKDVEISTELYYSWEEYLFVDDEGGKQLHLYAQSEPE